MKDDPPSGRWKGVIGVNAVEVVGARADAERVTMLCQLASGVWSHKLLEHEQTLFLIRLLIAMCGIGARE